MKNYLATLLILCFFLSSCEDDDPVATCNDGIQNGQETGIDCGSQDCGPCPDCFDGMMNGDETGIDCGGLNCIPCPTCNDGFWNGDEEGVDCGGNFCPPCPSCDDGIQNGNETGVDCGGNCDACLLGLTGPAGGIVFHDKENNLDGWRHLEARQMVLPLDITEIPWGCASTEVGGTSMDFGSGLENSNKIILANCTDQFFTTILGPEIFGYDDWYIPSVEELQAMFPYKNDIVTTANKRMWSSTEFDFQDVYVVDFGAALPQNSVYTWCKSSNNFCSPGQGQGMAGHILIRRF